MRNMSEINTEEQAKVDQDVARAAEVFKAALEFRPSIKPAMTVDEFKNLSPEDMLKEMNTPRISLHHADLDNRIPCLFFRFVGDKLPIVEAMFYPMEAICSFLDDARNFVRQYKTPEQTDKEVENIAFDRAIDMTLIMLDNFYKRAELMMDSFTSEVITQWHIQNNQRVIRYHAERGNLLPKRKDASLENTIKKYTKDVMGLWKYQGQTEDNWRKMHLAEEYEGISKHWNRLSKMLSEEDWRIYAKPEKHQDTPDDLLDELENTDRPYKETAARKVSELALEHAARRVGLIRKHGISKAVINQRKRGLIETGFTSTHLFGFLRKGRELREQLKTMEETMSKTK